MDYPTLLHLEHEHLAGRDDLEVRQSTWWITEGIYGWGRCMA